MPEFLEGDLAVVDVQAEVVHAALVAGPRNWLVLVQPTNQPYSTDDFEREAVDRP